MQIAYTIYFFILIIMPSTRTGYLAVKKETTPGDAVVPTHFIHYKTGDLMSNLEVITNNPIRATRWAAITAKSGKKASEGNFEMDLDYLEIGYWLGGLTAYPAVPTDNGDSTYTHQFDTADTLPALTIEQAIGTISSDTANEVRRGFGSYIDNLELAASDGLISAKVNVKCLGLFERARMLADAASGASVDISIEDIEGLVATDSMYISDDSSNESDPIVSIASAAKTIQIATLDNSYTIAANGKVELNPLTPSFVAQALMSFDMVSFQFGANLTAAASASEENVEDWTFTYNNNIEERYGSLRKSPSVIAPKGASSTLKFKRYFENRDDRDRYLNTTRQACIITIEDANTIIGSGTRNPSLVISISDLRYNAYALPTGTDELYVAEIEGECFYDISDARAVRMELTTTVADFSA